MICPFYQLFLRPIGLSSHTLKVHELVPFLYLIILGLKVNFYTYYWEVFFFLPTYTSVLFLQSLKGTLGYCSSDGTLYSLYRSDILGHNGIFSRIYINYMQLLSGTSHNPIYVLQMTQNYSASAHYVSNFIKFLISCSYDITWSFIAHIDILPSYFSLVLVSVNIS